MCMLDLRWLVRVGWCTLVGGRGRAGGGGRTDGRTDGRAGRECKLKTKNPHNDVGKNGFWRGVTPVIIPFRPAHGFGGVGIPSNSNCQKTENRTENGFHLGTPPARFRHLGGGDTSTHQTSSSPRSMRTRNLPRHSFFVRTRCSAIRQQPQQPCKDQR